MSEGFAAIPNWIIRDQRFSRKSILVYASLASRSGPGGIFPSQKTIAAELGISERTVRSALAELEELGVIERVRRHSGSRGKATRLPDGYVLMPNGKLPASSAGSSAKQPATTDVATGKNEQVAPYIEEEPVKKNPNPYSPQSVTDVETAFATFWNVYPRRAGKQAALKAFIKAAESAGTEVVLDGARRFRDDPNLPEPKFVPHPATWLNQGRWEDDPLPPRGGAVASSAAAGWFALAGEVESQGEISA